MATDDSPHSEKLERPWEQPGHARRDCEPHRGELLCTLTSLNLLFSLFTCPFLPIAFLTLPLGILLARLARRDIARMRKNEMDPQGLVKTVHAVEAGLNAVLVSLLSMSAWAAVLAIGYYAGK